MEFNNISDLRTKNSSIIHNNNSDIEVYIKDDKYFYIYFFQKEYYYYDYIIDIYCLSWQKLDK